MKHIASGKVREVYELSDDQLLIVSSDRISAFDVVMNEPVRDRGRLLTALTEFWLREVLSDIPNHLVSTDVPAEAKTIEDVEGRCMVVRKATVLPVEFIVRNYLAGTGFKEYQATGTLHGQKLPEGLALGSKLPEPVLTPSTKAELGQHDINLTMDEAADLIGADVLKEAEGMALEVFGRGAKLAEKQGFILADTKFELGYIDGTLSLCDEILTPDSSRYWEPTGWSPGETPPSYDKQILREYLETFTDWGKVAPPPVVTDEALNQIRSRYVEIYEKLTGRSFVDLAGRQQKLAHLIEVPEAFALRRIRSAGDAGEAWIRKLPSMVVELANLWDLRIDGEPLHGEVGLVLPVVRGNDPLMLKVSYPDRDSVHEALGLRTWGGDGAVHLIDYDKQRNAMLLERLHSHRSLQDVPRDEAVDVAVGLLKRLVATPVPGPRHLLDLVDQHTAFFHRIHGEVPPDQLAYAQEWLDAYYPAGDEVLINMDLHYGNVLAATREPWLVIDPKPLVAELSYGIAPLLWNLTPQEISSSLGIYFDRIVEILEVDRERARRWTVVRLIDYWIWSWETGRATEPVKCKHLVDVLINRQ